jgi:hypothetical protein
MSHMNLKMAGESHNTQKIDPWHNNEQIWRLCENYIPILEESTELLLSNLDVVLENIFSKAESLDMRMSNLLKV